MATVIKLGSKGAEVARLQKLLNQKLGLNPKLAEDGDFGRLTDSAVKSFQKQNGLFVDGIVGAKTWKAIDPSNPNAPQSDGDPKWLTIAFKETGQKEFPGKKHNPRIVEYHSTTTLRATTDETAWCSSFVNWCLLEAGHQGTNSAAAASWLKWGQEVAAKRGAIAVIYNASAANSSLSTSGNHVGFLISETKTHYIIFGGNQGNTVKESPFSKVKWTFKGYRWPK